MKECYNILIIADLHWGAVEASRLDYELESFLYFLKTYKNIDLVVIAGDYWNDKTNLNSKTSIKGNQWMHKLKDVCNSIGCKIRVIVGTKSHDNDQLDIFKPIEDESFKIFRSNTVEKTLDNCNFFYLPDENLNKDDYYDKYDSNIFNSGYIDVIFSHGNYDVILKDLPEQETEIQSINNIIFDYEFWNGLCYGPIISGHWHSYYKYKNLIYVGSYSRFGFGEEDDKGFLFLRYNTKTKEYYTKFIINRLARRYSTYVIDSAYMKSLDQCKSFVENLRDILKSDDDMKMRIKIIIRTSDPYIDELIDYVKRFFMNNKRVSIKTQNKIKEKEKEIIERKKEEIFEKYSFATDVNKEESEKIRSFILMKHNIDIPIEFINEYCLKIKDKMKSTE